MTPQLPKIFDPIKLAKLNASMKGQIFLRDLSRLQELSDQSDQVAKIDLQFGQDAGRTYFIKGEINTAINLVCQHCNKPMAYELHAEFALSPVVSDERAKNLPECYEPVTMENESVSAIDMIEDEILLALPMVPKHEVCDQRSVIGDQCQ